MQPTPEAMRNDFAEINGQMRERLRRVRRAASAPTLRAAGCAPPPRLVRLLVAHAFY